MQSEKPEVPFAMEGAPALSEWSQYECWVAHVKPRQEKALARDLAQLGIAYFLPQRCRKYVSGGRQRTSWLPVFPGYVFLAGSRADRVEVFATKRVANVLEVPALVRQPFCDQMLAIHQALETGMPLQSAPLAEGERVRIVDGPLAGQEGVVISIHEPRATVRIEIHLLGIALDAEVNWQDVQTVLEAS